MRGRAKCGICDLWDDIHNLPHCNYDDGEVWLIRAHLRCVEQFMENHTGRETWAAPKTVLKTQQKP